MQRSVVAVVASEWVCHQFNIYEGHNSKENHFRKATVILGGGGVNKNPKPSWLLIKSRALPTIFIFLNFANSAFVSFFVFWVEYHLSKLWQN